MLGYKMLSLERKLQEQTWSLFYSFNDNLKIRDWCNNQQASPEGATNNVCEILSEMKDIKHSKVSWTETVIKLKFCQEMGGGGKNINILRN
jgi:hypothetical protein